MKVVNRAMVNSHYWCSAWCLVFVTNNQLSSSRLRRSRNGDFPRWTIQVYEVQFNVRIYLFLVRILSSVTSIRILVLNFTHLIALCNLMSLGLPIWSIEF